MIKRTAVFAVLFTAAALSLRAFAADSPPEWAYLINPPNLPPAPDPGIPRRVPALKLAAARLKHKGRPASTALLGAAAGAPRSKATPTRRMASFGFAFDLPSRRGRREAQRQWELSGTYV